MGIRSGMVVLFASCDRIRKFLVWGSIHAHHLKDKIKEHEFSSFLKRKCV
jgi:hypothetical protein